MKIFINLPTWLGDAVMASPAIKAIYEHFKEASFVLYGSSVSTSLFKNMPNTRVIKERKKTRYSDIFKARKSLGGFDLAVSFRSAISSKLLLGILKAKKRYFFNKYSYQSLHQALQYIHFIQSGLGFSINKTALYLPIKPLAKMQVLAIAPGAKYGCAKRWGAAKFAAVAKHYAKDFSVILLGSKDEEDTCDEIQSILEKDGIKVKNLCSKTSITMLAKWLSSAAVLVTNDSGAMHVAAAFKTPTVAVFGPTAYQKTSPWENQNARLVHLNLLCMPCMQRTCPLKHHKCMEDLGSQLVIKACDELFGESAS